MTTVPSRYQQWRRRLGPVAFVLAIGVLVWQTCHHDDRVQTTILLDFGVRMPDVRGVDVDVHAGATSIGNFHRDVDAGGAMGRPSFRAVLPAADAMMTVVIRTASGTRSVERNVHGQSGGTVTVTLAGDVP